MEEWQQEMRPESENLFHTYRTHKIPFYVRLLWIGFYSLAIYYVLAYMFPAIRSEFRKSQSSSVRNSTDLQKTAVKQSP